MESQWPPMNSNVSSRKNILDSVCRISLGQLCKLVTCLHSLSISYWINNVELMKTLKLNMFSVTCYYFETEDSEFSMYWISNKYCNSNTLATSCEELTHWKRPWCWGGLGSGGEAEDEMAGWHHWLDARESEWTPGVGVGRGGPACSDSYGRKESDTTEWLNWTELMTHPHQISILMLKKWKPFL